MNGIASIKITQGELAGEYKLRFGMMGCAEFERRLMTNATPNAAKVFTDLVYGGLFGEAMRNEQPVPEYTLAADLIDAMSLEPDYKEQAELVQRVYEESKFGKDFIDNQKKKLEGLENTIR